MVIIDGHLQHTAIAELWRYMEEEFNWTCERIPVHYIIYSDVPAESALEKMKNSKLLSSPSANVLTCTHFTDVLKSFFAYGRSFHDFYKVPFDEAWITVFANDIESAKFIPAAFRTTYCRYIQATRIYLLCGDLPTVGESE